MTVSLGREGSVTGNTSEVGSAPVLATDVHDWLRGDEYKVVEYRRSQGGGGGIEEWELKAGRWQKGNRFDGNGLRREVWAGGRVIRKQNVAGETERCVR